MLTSTFNHPIENPRQVAWVTNKVCEAIMWHNHKNDADFMLRSASLHIQPKDGQAFFSVIFEISSTDLDADIRSFFNQIFA